MTLLRAEGLTKRYGAVTALDGVDLEISEGVTGLLGANGAGKSTLLKLALGLLALDAGSLHVLDTPVGSSPAQRARLGYAPEHDCLPRAVSAAEVVRYMAELSGLPRKAARSRAADTLRLVGLFEERHRAISSYSTGMRQRVKLAQALVHDPVLALLDEPTAGLDPLGRRDMLDLVSRVSREFGISIVLSTHLMTDVERICDAVVVLDAGRLLRGGPVSSFTTETQSLEIELAEGSHSLATVLGARGLDPLLDGNRVVLEEVKPDDYDVLRDAIVESGALLYRLVPRRHGLSDIFSGPAPPTDGRAH
jgi:ABC-2 type transport system ATP-binding protein